MLFKGTLAGSPTLANFFADIVGILTGSITTAGGLSAAWAAGATFTNTTAPGWSNYDAAAGSAANGVTPAVVRAAWSDSGSNYKNVYIGSLSATQLGFNGYETWNSGTHTGTNPIRAAMTASMFQSLTMTGGNAVVISASANHIYIQQGTSFTAVPVQQIFISEYTRDDPWCTVANGYPAWLQGGCGSGATNIEVANGGFPRLYSSAILADLTSVPFGNANTVVGGAVHIPNGLTLKSAPTQSTSNTSCNHPFVLISNPAPMGNLVGADSNKAAAKYLYELAWRQTGGSAAGWIANDTVFIGGNTSAKNQMVYAAPNSLGTVGDTLTVGAESYLLVGVVGGAAQRIALKDS